MYSCGHVDGKKRRLVFPPTPPLVAVTIFLILQPGGKGFASLCQCGAAGATCEILVTALLWLCVCVAEAFRFVPFRSYSNPLSLLKVIDYLMLITIL